MATIINNVALTGGAITSSAVTSNPSLLRIETAITGAGADEFVMLTIKVGASDLPLLDENYKPIQKKIKGNSSLSLNIAGINSDSIKVVLTPGAAGNAGSATVTTYETA